MAVKTSEFEEKEFETSLYNQLECGTRLVWSPGQVFEAHIGIDRALFLSDPSIWRFFGVTRQVPGVFLDRYEWEFLRNRRRPRTLPNFRLNLFIQAKRSNYYSLCPKHMRRQMGPIPCWRFDVCHDQQNALENVAARLGNQAVVTYAAPAFHRLTELYAHTVNNCIIPNSTFPLVCNLTGHKSWYYSGPGGAGFANIDPEPFDGVGLERLIRQAQENRQSSSVPPDEQLQALGNLIHKCINIDISQANPRKVIYFMRLRELEHSFQDLDIENKAAVLAFCRVALFATVFDVEWYVI